MDADTKGISCCFDEESARMLEHYRNDGFDSTARVIISTVESRGILGATILEVGCGYGALSLEFLKNGASSALGIDLSPRMLEAARAMASEAGFVESASFRLGDGAKTTLPKSDVVVLDAVVCCYPDVESLLDNTSAASRRLYAISFPDDMRPITRVLRLFLPLQGFLLRRGSFRFFIHPAGKIIRRLEQRGFVLVHDSTAGRLWSVLVFAAPVPS